MIRLLTLILHYQTVGSRSHSNIEEMQLSYLKIVFGGICSVLLQFHLHEIKNF